MNNWTHSFCFRTIETNEWAVPLLQRQQQPLQPSHKQCSSGEAMLSVQTDWQKYIHTHQLNDYNVHSIYSHRSNDSVVSVNDLMMCEIIHWFIWIFRDVHSHNSPFRMYLVKNVLHDTLIILTIFWVETLFAGWRIDENQDKNVWLSDKKAQLTNNVRLPDVRGPLSRWLRLVPVGIKSIEIASCKVL